MQGHLRVVWKMLDRDSGVGRDLRWRCQRGHRRAKQWPQTGAGVDSGKGWCKCATQGH